MAEREFGVERSRGEAHNDGDATRRDADAGAETRDAYRTVGSSRMRGCAGRRATCELEWRRERRKKRSTADDLKRSGATRYIAANGAQCEVGVHVAVE